MSIVNWVGTSRCPWLRKWAQSLPACSSAFSSNQSLQALSRILSRCAGYRMKPIYTAGMTFLLGLSLGNLNIIWGASARIKSPIVCVEFWFVKRWRNVVWSNFIRYLMILISQISSEADSVKSYLSLTWTNSIIKVRPTRAPSFSKEKWLISLQIGAY